MHRFTRDIKAGVEWNAKEDEAGFVANWRVLAETAERPAVIVGTSSDRIGTPSGQAYYATVSKGFGRIAPYAGASYGTFEERVVFPFGVNVALPRGVSAMLMNDGVHTHLSMTYRAVTLLLIERKKIGVTVGFSF